MTTSATTAAAVVAEENQRTSTSTSTSTTCSKVLYNNARCGQPVFSPSVDYCTHHRPDRIPCPVDPRHFVSVKGLNKHVRKCNATKKVTALSACPFFSKGINRGRSGVPTALERLAQEEAAKDLSGTKRPRLATGRKRAAEEMGHDKLLELLARVRKAADEVLPPLGTATTTSAVAAAAAAAAAKPLVSAAPRPTSLKHDSQNDGIVSIALETGVFGSRRRSRRNTDGGSGGGGDGDGEPKDSSSSPSSSVAVVELGAGRGYLGAAAADALVRLDGEDEEIKESPARLPLKCSSLTLVDRRAYRNKAERHYRSIIGSGSGEEAMRKRKEAETAAAAAAAAGAERRKPPFALCRATVDLSDVLLSSLPGVASSASIALLGKHLCGSATDLSLRAAVTQLRLSEEKGSDNGKRHPLSGLAVATCCHHCCSWSDFAGKREFLALGFTADEFEVVSQASAWATGGHGRPSSKGKEGERKRKSKSGDEGDECDEGDEGESGSEQEEQDEEDENELAGDPAKHPRRRCWQSRIPIADRRAAGDAAKRLLDGCRVRWLERQARRASSPSSSSSSSTSLLVVEARAYAPEGVTGENRLIVAVPRGSGSGGGGGGGGKAGA